MQRQIWNILIEWWETFQQAWKQKWIWFTIALGAVNALPFFQLACPNHISKDLARVVQMIPWYGWIIIWSVFFNIMILEYATKLRLRPYKAFREFIDTMLQRIDVLLSAHQLDIPQAKKDMLKIHKAILKAFGELTGSDERFKKHRQQFLGYFEDFGRVNREEPLTEEQERATLRELRRVTERIGDSSSWKYLLPGFDVSALKRIEEEG